MTASPQAHNTPKRWPWFLAAALVTATVTGVAASDPILHEFFIMPVGEGQRGQEGDGEQDRDGPISAGAEALGDALNEPSSAPPLTIENRGDEMEVGANGEPMSPDGGAPAAHNGPFDNEDLAKPDRDTKLDSELSYYTVFNPSIVPWKRVNARDEVHNDYSLGVRDRRTHKIAVKDKQKRANHEEFWGSMLLHMRKGARLPLPSVAPQAEILRYQTEPPTRLEFYKDAADNFYVSGNHDGVVRVNYLMAVHKNYFGGEVDPSIRVGDLARQLRPRLPAQMRASVDQVVETIGIDRSAPLRQQLDALVAWFRSFDAQDFPASQKSQDIYLDLALSKLGVCRHRAFAFVVTAHGLGILARYVHNEAHAFVEVMIPRRGWLRIDLGGAAVDFQVRNSNDKLLHEPAEQDQFTQPEGFTDSYSHRLAQGDGQADIDNDGQLDPIEGAPERSTAQLGPQDNPQGGFFDEDNSMSNVEGPDGDEGQEAPEQALTFPGEPANGNNPGQGDNDSGQGNNPVPTLKPTSLKLVSANQNVFRGDKMEITGVLNNAAGDPLSDAPIEIFLVPKGKHAPEDFVQIGQAKTNANGEMTTEVEIPDTVALGRWSLYLYFRGNKRFTPSHSK